MKFLEKNKINVQSLENKEKWIRSGLICLMGPVLLTLYGNEFLDNAEQRLLTPTVTYAKESILVIYDDNDEIKIYSTSGI